MSPIKNINQTDKEKASLAALKTVAGDTKIVLERVERLERMLVSIKSDLDTAMKDVGEGIFIRYRQDEQKYTSLPNWLRTIQKRIDEVL